MARTARHKSQVYLKPVSDPVEAERLRAAIQKAGPFYAGGRFTLSIPIAEGTIDAARTGLKIMFEWEQQERQPRNTPPPVAEPSN